MCRVMPYINGRLWGHTKTVGQRDFEFSRVALPLPPPKDEDRRPFTSRPTVAWKADGTPVRLAPHVPHHGPMAGSGP